MASRGERGRFLPGHTIPGPGRPRRQTERKYLRSLAAVVKLTDWREIVRRAVEDAKAGDAQARNWLSKHLCGDEPLALAELVEELQAELERLRHGNANAGADGANPPGAGPSPDGNGRAPSAP
jgi:hypothetical protein